MGSGSDTKVVQSRIKILKVGISAVIFAVSIGELATHDNTDQRRGGLCRAGMLGNVRG